MSGHSDMTTGAESIRVMHPLFHTGESGSIPTSALQLRVEPLPFERALELNAAWHSILPRFGTGFIKKQPFPCFAATYGGLIYAVAIWSNPVARKLPQKTWLELRRMAIAPDAPKNTASRMLKVMRLLIHRSRPEILRLVSYQSKKEHTGAIYRADGWRETALSSAKSWNMPGRPRPPSQQLDDRVRWERNVVGPPDTIKEGESR